MLTEMVVPPLRHLWLLLLAGCFSAAPTLPPHLGEGTRVMDPGHVSLNVAAGGGAGAGQNQVGTFASEAGGGFEVRLRSGIGAKSELGISAFLGVTTPIGGGDPPFAVGGKLSYKIAPVKWFAIVADAGAMDYRVAATAVFSGDLAVILAPYTSADGQQLYLGVKGAFSVPVVSGSSIVDESIVLPIGYEIPLSRRTRFTLEAGPIFGFSQQSPNLPAGSNMFAGYGIAALTFFLR